MGIKIVSDNCCDLDTELLKKHNICLTHLTVRFGDRVYQPGELTNASFYEKMNTSPTLPYTSQPTVEEINQVYTDALADGSEVIAIHMSSGLSGTYQGGVMVKNMLNNPRLHVFDSRKASVGLGLLVLEAARMAERGETVAAILQRLQEMQARMQCIFVVGRLDCLIKGGRISRAKGAIAEVLDIKPVLHMDEGGYIMLYDKARGFKGAQQKLISIMEKNYAKSSSPTVGICHSAVPNIADSLKKSIQKNLDLQDIIIGEIGPIIGSHVGMGTFSVFFEK
ncbi:DegV [Syntrophomonas zehnderi OL-4]|uniref:DegV n=1 Tax=Syntrophomonas zehnderi OL-4 TaxID=690567 RepID=A0A0E4C9K5_9FIRM|nr:DegV family protein [Syntrophomonas zehnderi]CFY01744.1 DegV [Syntrophomonas zehnderi OL-4]